MPTPGLGAKSIFHQARSENMLGLAGIEPTTSSLRGVVFYDCDTVISIIWHPITFNYVPKTFTAEVQMVRQNCEDLDRHRRSPLSAGYNDPGVRDWLKKSARAGLRGYSVR